MFRPCLRQKPFLPNSISLLSGSSSTCRLSQVLALLDSQPLVYDFRLCLVSTSLSRRYSYNLWNLPPNSRCHLLQKIHTKSVGCDISKKEYVLFYVVKFFSSSESYRNWRDSHAELCMLKMTLYLRKNPENVRRLRIELQLLFTNFVSFNVLYFHNGLTSSYSRLF